jgi:hypothetical protein
MPPELQERGVTEAAWEEFAREAEAIMRKNDICDRYHCCLPCLPIVLCWFVYIAIEESAVKTDSAENADILAGVEGVVALLAFAVIFFLCVRLRAVGKAMHHDLDGLSQRVLSPYKIHAHHQAPRGTAAQPGSQKPEMLVFTFYGDAESA